VNHFAHRKENNISKEGNITTCRVMRGTSCLRKIVHCGIQYYIKRFSSGIF
jgi:hypothetical protein